MRREECSPSPAPQFAICNLQFAIANSRRPGVVLISVLIVVALLSLAAYHFSERMMAEYQAMDSYTRTAQAKSLADSGIHYTAALLSDPDSVRQHSQRQSLG